MSSLWFLIEKQDLFVYVYNLKLTFLVWFLIKVTFFVFVFDSEMSNFVNIYELDMAFLFFSISGLNRNFHHQVTFHPNTISMMSTKPTCFGQLVLAALGGSPSFPILSTQGHCQNNLSHQIHTGNIRISEVEYI